MTKIYPGWLQVMVAFVVQGVSAATVFSSYSVVVAPFKLEFAPSNMTLMLGITITVLASGILSPIIGTALDRFSMRKLMTIGAGMIASGFLLFTVATSMIHVLLIYGVCMALGSILLGPIACTALLARWFTRRRGLAMGLAASGSALGGLLFPPLLQTLIDGYEWRTAFQLIALIIVLLTVPLILLFVVDRPTAAQSIVEQAIIEQPVDGDERQSEVAPVVQDTAQTRVSPYKERNFWLLALVIGTAFCGPMALVSNMMQVASEKGIGGTEAAWLISVYAGACLVGKLMTTFIVDHVNQRMGLAATLCLIGLGIMGFLQGDNYSLLVAACVVTGLASGSTLLLWSVILTHTYGAGRAGEMMGKMTLLIMPFTLLAPPLFGWASDYTGSYNNAFLGYLALVMVALIVLTQVHVAQIRRQVLQPAS